MSPRKRILEYLKSAGPTSAAQLGEALGSTKMAVLQQLHTLEEQVDGRPCSGRLPPPLRNSFRMLTPS